MRISGLKKNLKTNIGWIRRYGLMIQDGLGAIIDDMTALNDCSEFERNLRKIYSPVLELKKENLGYHEGSLLYLKTTIKDKKVFSKLFSQRDSLPVLIVRTLYLNSNISSEIFHSAIGAALLRSTRMINNVTIFQRNSKIQINQMMKQDGKINSLLITLNILSVAFIVFDVFHKRNSTSPKFSESLQHR